MEARDAITDRQARHWNTVAAGWGAWLDWTEANFQPVTAWLAHALAWRPGMRLLDVACGAGYPSFAAARGIGSSGRVVAVDLSPAMIAVASNRAKAAGLDWVEFTTMSAEQLEFADAAFDGCVNAYGLMFCADPVRAIAEAHRVAAPGGRIAAVVWDEPVNNPFFTTLRSAIGDLVKLPEPGPDEPAPFRLASIDRLRDVFEQAGVADVAIDRVPMTLETASIADYGQLFIDLSLKIRVSTLSRAERTHFDEAIAAAARPHLADTRVRLLATSLCAVARKTGTSNCEVV
jgi:SAM-dependent methyltransferase